MLWIFLLSFFSRADVLFIDLNDVDKEIEAARSSGRKVITIPRNKEKLKQENFAANNKRREADQLSHKIEKCLETKADCTSLRVQRENLLQEASRLSKPYTPEMLSKDLEAVLAENPNGFQTVAISGHDGYGTIYGDFGRIESDQFADVFKKFRGRDKVKSVALLGCGSSFQSAHSSTWLPSFPNAFIVAGYEETGFLKDNPEGHRFIRDYLMNESSILASTTIEEAQKKFAIISPKRLGYGASACFVLPGKEPYLYSTRFNSGYLKDLMKCEDSGFIKALTALQCANKENATCNDHFDQFNDISGNFEKCRFLIPENGQTIDQLRDRFYVMRNFGTPGSLFSYKNIFSKVDPGLQDLVKNPDEIRGARDAISRLREVKHAYDRQFENLEDLEVLPLSKLNSLAEKKIYFDLMWSGVSNQDPNVLSSARKIPKNQGGVLRAQAFLRKNSGPSSEAAIQDRVKNLRARIPELKPGDDIETVQGEINYLLEHSR